MTKLKLILQRSVCCSNVTFDWLSSVGDVEVVSAGFVWDVIHTAAAVLVVSAGHLGLRRTLHGQTQTAGSCPSALGTMGVSGQKGG